MVEVVWEWALGDLFGILPSEDQAEFGLGWTPGRMERGRGGGLADGDEDPGDDLLVWLWSRQQPAVPKGI